MSDVENLANALALLSKAIRPLSDDDLKLLQSGEAKLTLLRPGHRLVQNSKALDQALKVLQQLSDNELRLLEDRQAKLALIRKGDKIVSPLDLPDVAEQVAKLTSEGEIVRLLETDSRLSPPNLKKLAAELNIGIPATVKTKPALQVHIAQSVVRDRGRWSWR